MSQGDSFQRLPWRSTDSIAVAYQVVPDAPGLYVYAELDELHGLPVGQEWMYVGKTRSLAARLARHQVHLEKNRLLRDWLHRPGRRRLYYTELEESLLDRIERDLVVSLHPRLNRIRYRQHTLSC